MKQIRDAIVIGSGIIGSATALALIRAGIRRVTLIEKGPLVSGMTRRSAGLVHPFQPDPLLSQLADASYDFYNQWAMQLGGKSLFVETGAAVLGAPGSDTESQFAMWRRTLPDANEVQPGGLGALFPAVAASYQRAMFTPRAGYADAVLTAQAMVNAAKERGLEVQTGTQVKQIIVQMRQVQSVKTTTGELEAPIVVVAAGAWTARLLAPLGVAVQLLSRRGALFFYEQPRDQSQEFPMLLDAEGNEMLRPHPYRMFAAGRISEAIQTSSVDSLDEYIPASDAAAVNRVLANWIPALANLTPKRSHATLYDTMSDGLPAFGRVSSINGLYVTAGFGPSAFSVAPAVGETLAQLLIDGQSARDVSSFDPLRPNTLS